MGPDANIDVLLPHHFILRGVVLDGEADANRPMPQRIRVMEVLWGDPALKEVSLRQVEQGLPPGRELILFVLPPTEQAGVSYALPDTAANRRAVADAITARQRRRLQMDFVDDGAWAAEGARLLREYLAAVAEEVPDHPYLGKKAIAHLPIVTTARPPGAYAAIEAEVRLTPTSGGDTHLLPHGQGVRLYVSIAPDGRYRVGAHHWPGYFGGSIFYERRRGYARSRVLAHYASAQMGTGKQMLLLREVPGEQAQLGELLDRKFREMAKRLATLQADPPRDLDAAIRCVAAHHDAKRRDKPLPEHLEMLGGRGNPPLHAAFQARGNPPLHAAFQALSSRFAEKHLSPAQKTRLIPILVDLLMDRSVLLNETPYDGPITLVHHAAYPLLHAITGQDLPSPYGHPPRGLKSDRGPPTPEERRQAHQQVQDRLRAWQAWWQKQSRGAPDSAM